MITETNKITKENYESNLIKAIEHLDLNTLESLKTLEELFLFQRNEFNDAYSFTTAYNLALIYLINDNPFNAKNIIESKGYNEKVKGEKEIFTAFITSIGKMINDPYSNVYSTLSIICSINDTLTSKLIKLFFGLYEQRQAEFFSTIYTNISEKTLLVLLTPHVVESNLGEYISKYNLKRVSSNKGSFVSFENFNKNNIKFNSTSDSTGKYTSIENKNMSSNLSFMENLLFVNKKACELENTVKANLFIK